MTGRGCTSHPAYGPDALVRTAGQEAARGILSDRPAHRGLARVHRSDVLATRDMAFLRPHGPPPAAVVFHRPAGLVHIAVHRWVCVTCCFSVHASRSRVNAGGHERSPRVTGWRVPEGGCFPGCPGLLEAPRLVGGTGCAFTRTPAAALGEERGISRRPPLVPRGPSPPPGSPPPTSPSALP